MNIYTISDLHLAFSAQKPMDIFGEYWKDHPQKIKRAWQDIVAPEDLVLVPGDISWGMKFDDASADLGFLGDLPGTKIIVKGNHDYWWQSMKKMKENLPDSIIPLQNSSYVSNGIGIAGTRLWIDPDLHLEQATPEDTKIFDRELGRLVASLKSLPKDLDKRIVMTHFPPITLDGKPGSAVKIAREYGCDLWVFGHMHLFSLDYAGFNTTIGGIRFEFASADYLGFKPKHLLAVP